MLFSEIPGLVDLKKKLIEAVQANHVAHAQLFAGKPGALNLTLALAYATYLHCQNKGAADACGTCAACSKSLKFIHPDTHFVFPIGNMKGEKEKDDEKEKEKNKAEILKLWRTFLIEHHYGDLGDWISSYGGEDKQALISRNASREIVKALSLKPFESKHKVMIIWLPEYMHSSAANGILKLLEEPPADTFFILVSNAIEQLLPTILSRTQIVQVPLLDDAEIEKFLTTRGVEGRRLHDIVALAEGDLNQAIALIESEQDHFHESFAAWMRICFSSKYNEMLAKMEEFDERDKLGKQNFLKYTLTMMRETLVYLSGASSINRVKENEIAFIEKFSKFMTLQKVETISQLISEASYHLERNASAKMIFLDLSLQISKLMRSDNV